MDSANATKDLLGIHVLDGAATTFTKTVQMYVPLTVSARVQTLVSATLVIQVIIAQLHSTRMLTMQVTILSRVALEIETGSTWRLFPY